MLLITRMITDRIGLITVVVVVVVLVVVVLVVVVGIRRAI